MSFLKSLTRNVQFLSVHKGCGNGSMIVFTPDGKGKIVNDKNCIEQVKPIMASTTGCDIGRGRIWPNRIWPIPHLANFVFGGGLKGWGRKGGGPDPEKVGPEGLGGRRVGGPKFRAFFALSHRKFHSFFSLGVFSWNFGGV